MKRHPTTIVDMTNSDGSCVDEKLNNVECDIFVAASVVERSTSIIIIGSAGSFRKIFKNTSNNSLVDNDSFILACLKEKIIIVNIP
jgi:hypothetical protein